MPKAIIPRRQWPKIRFVEKDPITAAEHEKIISAEKNPQWQAYYNLLWHLGGAQSDVAGLKAENIDWHMRVIGFERRKTGSIVQFHFGSEVATILETLPKEGFLPPAPLPRTTRS